MTWIKKCSDGLFLENRDAKQRLEYAANVEQVSGRWSSQGDAAFCTFLQYVSVRWRTNGWHLKKKGNSSRVGEIFALIRAIASLQNLLVRWAIK